MKKLLLLLVIIVTTSQMLAQQDSLVLSKVVRDEITKARQKEQIPLQAQQSAGAVEQSVKNRSFVPQSIFFGIFAGSQLMLAVGFLIIRRKRRSEARAQAKPRKRVDLGNSRRAAVDPKQMRSIVGCQLQLLRTREELMEQARKLNVGAGELELAWKLQELSTKS